MDGTGVPMRAAEVAGRAGKQPDGTAKTPEVQLVTVWTAESRDEENKPVRDAGSITFSAAIESAAVPDTSLTRSDFAERVVREATRRGFTEAPSCAVLGDGSAWIWNTTGELFPQAIQILDRFHAKQHLSDVGKIIHRANSEERRQWIQQRYDELDEGRIEPLLQALDQRAPEYDESTQVRRILSAQSRTHTLSPTPEGDQTPGFWKQRMGEMFRGRDVEGFSPVCAGSIYIKYLGFSLRGCR